jgi:gliding motility-associated-like protein
MKNKMSALLHGMIPLICLFMNLSVAAQVANPYYMNGSATQDNCNCYTLTPDANTRSGSVWNIYKINLKDTFDFKFSVYLGATDANGADGIAFVLQPISTQVGSTGGGLGFSGVTPSIGVTIDTWQNSDNNDPLHDHIAIQRNGDLGHQSVNNLAGPVTALASSDNIEDGNWHLLQVQWNPSTKILKASMDGVDRVSATIDLVATVFNNDPEVFWGFTASTGGARNLQRFCTALDPRVKNLSAQETCFGKPITFQDSSSSFSKVVKWFWDFGDGTTDTLPNPPPHLYAAPGNYTVKLNILGNNGCLSDTLRQPVIVGSDPFTNIKWAPDPVCAFAPVQFRDSSQVAYGTVNQWAWNVGGANFTTQNPYLPGGLPAGRQSISLRVRTAEGCISSVVTKEVDILPLPAADIITNGFLCAGETITISGTSLTPSIPITKWIWDLGDGRKDSSGSSIVPKFASGGSYLISLLVRGINGCQSIPDTATISVFETKAFAGNDTIVGLGLPFQLMGSGGLIYSWSPAFGLSDPNISNPIASLTADAFYVLTVSTPAGCETSDTINIRVFKGPEIYVPTAFTPNGDGLNDLLKALPIGLTLNYLKIFDRWGNLVFSTTDPRIGWDGRVRGKDSPTAIFIWTVSGSDSTGRTIVKKGTLQLIR